MRTTKTLSISLPPNRLKDMERTAKKENRTMSELIRELYRRYKSDQARQEFGRVLEAFRTEAAKTPASKLSVRQVDREIAAARAPLLKRLIADQE
jgi:metal-responsive CopG/Arc/MetJ family transcriptional regulator